MLQISEIISSVLKFSLSGQYPCNEPLLLTLTTLDIPSLDVIEMFLTLLLQNPAAQQEISTSSEHCHSQACTVKLRDKHTHWELINADSNQQFCLHRGKSLLRVERQLKMRLKCDEPQPFFLLSRVFNLPLKGIYEYPLVIHHISFFQEVSWPRASIILQHLKSKPNWIPGGYSQVIIYNQQVCKNPPLRGRKAET